MNRKLASLRAFFLYLKKNGVIESDPSLKVSSGKAIHKYPSVLSMKEVGNIFRLNYGTGKLAARDRAMLEFLYSTGCRVQEAVSLNKKNIDLIGETARVCGKGAKERIVPLGREAIASIHEYFKIRERQGWGRKSDAAFVTVNGRRISARTISRIVKKYAIKAGITKKVSPHTLRHTFATHMLDAGCNLRIVQELLGHSRLQTTQRYTHLTRKKLKEVYRKFHPRSK
jgi:site-specific recombinase XerD